MNTSSLIVSTLLVCGSCLNVSAQSSPSATAPATATNAPDSLPVSQDKAAAQKLFESWKAPLPPRRLVGNIHYVGLAGVCSFLIATPEGHILIDTTFEESVPSICRKIEQLGFRVGDLKLILSSHAHADHTGGHALMKRITGARIVASAADARILETGGADDFSPFPKELLAYTPVKADQIVKDGEEVLLGGVTLTAHLTPGHTKGATTWTMKTREGTNDYHVAFFSSVSLVAPTQLLNNPEYPAIVQDYAATFKKLKAMTCDIFFGPHGDQFGLAQKLRRLDQNPATNPFVDPEGWRRLIISNENSYRRQLEAERAGK